MIRAINLYKNYTEFFHKKEKKIPVIKGISFTIEKGEFIGIMGRSGCGKTTLLKMIGLIEVPSGGELFIMEKDVAAMSVSMRSDLRRTRIGFVFQDCELMSGLRVCDNIGLPLLLNKKRNSEIDKKVRKLGKDFGISNLLDKYPYDLSGGERQRAAICRALVNEPDLILADEPTGNLDSISGRTVMESFVRINEVFAKTILMVTHDSLMASYCNRVIFLKDGEIEGNIERKKYKSQEAYYQNIIDISATL